ncbi:MAG: hypothetical protein EHM55_00685 [Acidobacteria bacterium]|nr:MAG: hypothetical protein EHM55_00685 [Acidobacteriota bacterium]
MKHLSTWLAFGAGSATTAGVLWLTAAVYAQGGYQNAVHVCVAGDGVMRVATGTCQPGQRSLYLKKAGEEIEKADEPDDNTQNDKRLADLERRIKILESPAVTRTTGRTTVVAPFEVVDRSGRRIFAVEEGVVVSVYSGSRPVAVIKATDTGGHFTGYSTSGDLQASVGASGTRSGIIITEGGAERIYVGKQESGHYGAKFFSKGGGYVAAIGQSLIGTGLAGVYDSDGSPRALLRTTDDGQHGHISVHNGQTTVAELTVGQTGGGLLTIGSSSGERMVTAGVQPGNFGVVQAGPSSFGTAAGVPLPGSYISGKP